MIVTLGRSAYTSRGCVGLRVVWIITGVRGHATSMRPES